MIDGAYFSVVSPESCSNILWKTTDKADVAARALGLTAQKLYSLGIIDKIIKNMDPEYLLEEIYKEIVGLSKKSSKELLDLRYEKFRTIGY